MATTWTVKSKPPHDFFICLDIDQYFDFEHEPEHIFERGYTRPIPVNGRDVLCTIMFNGDPENPEFYIKSAEVLEAGEVEEANRVISRILGTDLDLRPFYDRASGDAVLGPLLTSLYGLKRMSRANFFEDALNRIIVAQIRHKPTAKKMVYNVREAYGVRLEYEGGTISAWPRPHRLVTADPAAMKKHGLSLRKGEYVTGLADEIVSGRISQRQMESLAPADFYTRANAIRGIGPTTAQDLMLMRNRPDAIFPSEIDKGEEKGLRRWIIYSYGGDPDRTPDADFREMTQNWRGYESCALEFLFVNWVLSEIRKGRK